jgi:hypothetical protein
VSPLIATTLPAILLLAGCAQRGPMTPWEGFPTELRQRGSCGSGREPRVILQRLQRIVISHPHLGHGRLGPGRSCSFHQVGGTAPELAVLRGNWGWTPWQVWSVAEWAEAPDRGVPVPDGSERGRSTRLPMRARCSGAPSRR